MVIGSGPGGYAAALRAARLGADVTLVEKERVGGTCLNWGCIPSKVMKTAADTLDRIRRARELGIHVPGAARLDMPGLMARKEQVIGAQAQGLLHLFKRHGVRYLEGHGRIEGPGRASVARSDGGRDELAWDRLILAVGSRPAPLSGLPFDGTTILSSDHALSLNEIPESMVIVGGGVIGCEFASIFAALGAEVTVVEAMPRLLPVRGVDESTVKTLLREMKKRKIRVITHAGVSSVQEEQGHCSVRIGPSPVSAEGEEGSRTGAVEDIQASCVLVCVGRCPNSKDLGLENLALNTDSMGWVPVDHGLQTGVPGVYAIGDMLGPSRIMLAHVATAEGRIAAENALGGSRTMNYDVVPSAIFTSPEIGVAGLTEVEALKAGHEVRSETVLFRLVGKAQVLGEMAGEAKIVFEEKTGRLLGAHLVGPGATDLVAEAVLAIRSECSVDDLADTIHAHPTLSEILPEVAGKAAGRPFHG